MLLPGLTLHSLSEKEACRIGGISPCASFQEECGRGKNPSKAGCVPGAWGTLTWPL